MRKKSVNRKKNVRVACSFVPLRPKIFKFNLAITCPIARNGQYKG